MCGVSTGPLRSTEAPPRAPGAGDGVQTVQRPAPPGRLPTMVEGPLSVPWNTAATSHVQPLSTGNAGGATDGQHLPFCLPLIVTQKATGGQQLVWGTAQVGAPRQSWRDGGHSRRQDEVTSVGKGSWAKANARDTDGAGSSLGLDSPDGELLAMLCTRLEKARRVSSPTTWASRRSGRCVRVKGEWRCI